MTDWSLLAAQVRAARGLLGWSQAELAAHIKVSRSTIADLESNKRRPHEATMFVLLSELAGAGINFTDLGVEFREFPPRRQRPTDGRSKPKTTR